MSQYSTTPMCGEAFDMCIACSQPVLDNFRGDKETAIQFLLKACNQPGFLEEASGIADKLKALDLDGMDDFAVDDFDCPDMDFPEEEEV